jgi:SAM-dependent methyltransferase
MKSFERVHLALEPFLAPLYRTVRQRLLHIAGGRRDARILDVGGRRSPYTIGVPGRIVVTDLPRQSDTQHELGLGLTSTELHRLRARRSNIGHIVFDDMTQSGLRDSSFDCVVAVEVLEHVEDDASFLAEVRRVLRPGGTFLATTPNGDWVVNTNPDHKRHYTRTQLREALSASLDAVSVEYAIRDSKARTLGLRSWSPRRPVETLVTMGCNAISTWESSAARLATQADGTRHLIATGRRPAASR